MLAPMIFELLIASLLFLLAGWATDTLRANWHDGSSCVNCEGTIGWERVKRPRNPLRDGDPKAMQQTRLGWRHRST
jgi:hypothetical protein